MEARFDGKVALVTGASRGIGEAIAVELLEAGANGVTITGRKPENLDETIQRIGDSDRVLALVARADDADAADRTVAATIERFGGCDVLVNNAGTNPAAGPLTKVDLGAVDRPGRSTCAGLCCGRGPCGVRRCPSTAAPS